MPWFDPASRGLPGRLAKLVRTVDALGIATVPHQESNAGYIQLWACELIFRPANIASRRDTIAHGVAVVLLPVFRLSL
jgi:hypothetical protein